MLTTDACVLDEPGAPGRPEPTDWDKDFVDLKWEPPKNDGGAPITGFIVEKKERGTGKWVKALETPGQYGMAKPVGIEVFHMATPGLMQSYLIGKLMFFLFTLLKSSRK